MNPSFPVLPCDHGSEAALLSHVLHHPEQSALLLKDLSPKSFDHPHHRLIAWLIWQHRRAGTSWNSRILADTLLKQSNGGDPTLSEEARQVLVTFQELAGQQAESLSRSRTASGSA